MSNIVNTDFSLDKPSELINFSNELKKVIVEQRLYTNIQGRNYIHAEAWVFCGAVLGVMPIVDSLEDLSSEEKIKYRAAISLKRVSSGDIVGSGVAICTNKEKGKQLFDEYAIAGMAQTRAISRAYRNAFGWLIKLAGYEATPVDEMQYETPVDKKEEIINAHTTQRRTEN
jgi:hypothetical protein